MVNLIDYGFEPIMITENETRTPARVTAVHKDRYEIVSSHGISHARLKASIYWGEGIEEFPITGDFVLINYTDNSDSQIVKTLSRKAKFARNDFSGHAATYVKTVLEQVVAANFDYVFILASLNFDFNIKRIVRYLTFALQSGAVPVVLLTKSDLVENHSEQVKEVQKVAADIGVYAISAVTGYGMNQLSDYLQPQKTIVFLGSSGVGKSSLVNALAKKNIMGVKEIRSQDSRGRHTTTHRQLIMLPCGAMLIDTPGMRELGMWDAFAGLSESFADVEQYLVQCKFSNCTHQSEPGCAINGAIENGILTQKRWDIYQKMTHEMKFVTKKAEYLKSGESTDKRSKLKKKTKNHKIIGQNELEAFMDNQMNEEIYNAKGEHFV